MEIDAAVQDQQKDFVGPSLALTAESEFNQIDRKSKQKVYIRLVYKQINPILFIYNFNSYFWNLILFNLQGRLRGFNKRHALWKFV